MSDHAHSGWRGHWRARSELLLLPLQPFMNLIVRDVSARQPELFDRLGRHQTSRFIIQLQRRGLANHWGYAPAAWLAPDPRYWSGRAGTTPADELAEAIDALHAAGFEVVLDVVFNHTAELDADGPLSLRGLANARAYHLDPQDPARYRDWSGCGNAVNLGEPRMVELVMGALRHWATRYRVGTASASILR